MCRTTIPSDVLHFRSQRRFDLQGILKLLKRVAVQKLCVYIGFHFQRWNVMKDNRSRRNVTLKVMVAKVCIFAVFRLSLTLCYEHRRTVPEVVVRLGCQYFVDD